MLFFAHTDVPDIIGRAGTVFGQHEDNIGQMSPITLFSIRKPWQLSRMDNGTSTCHSGAFSC